MNVAGQHAVKGKKVCRWILIVLKCTMSISHPSCFSSPLLSPVKDTVAVVADDPLTAKSYSLHISEDVSSMPLGESLARLLQPYKKYEDNVLKCVHSSRHRLCVGGKRNAAIKCIATRNCSCLVILDYPLLLLRFIPPLYFH